MKFYIKLALSVIWVIAKTTFILIWVVVFLSPIQDSFVDQDIEEWRQRVIFIWWLLVGFGIALEVLNRGVININKLVEEETEAKEGKIILRVRQQRKN